MKVHSSVLLRQEEGDCKVPVVNNIGCGHVITCYSVIVHVASFAERVHVCQSIMLGCY